MQFNEAVVATLVPIAFLIVSFAILYSILHFRNRATGYRHQQRLAALEKGIELPPEPVASLGRHAYLLRGLIWLFVGVAIAIFFLSLYWTQKDRDILPPSTLGLIPVGVGAAYLIVYRVEGKSDPKI